MHENCLTVFKYKISHYKVKKKIEVTAGKIN